MIYVTTHAGARRNARGRSAQDHPAAASRCLYRRAVGNALIKETDNPAHKIAEPRRLPTTRRALPHARLADQPGHCGAPRRYPGRHARTCPSASRRTGPSDGSSPAAVAPHDGAVQARQRQSRLKPDISSSLLQSVTAWTAVTARDPPF
jgi:hypothetical protein